MIACSGRIQQFESFAGFTLSTEIDFQSMEGILEPVEVGSLSLCSIYKDFIHPRVVQDFFHQQYYSCAFPKLNVRRPEVGQLAAGEVLHVLEAWLVHRGEPRHGHPLGRLTGIKHVSCYKIPISRGYNPKVPICKAIYEGL